MRSCQDPPNPPKERWAIAREHRWQAAQRTEKKLARRWPIRPLCPPVPSLLRVEGGGTAVRRHGQSSAERDISFIFPLRVAGGYWWQDLFK